MNCSYRKTAIGAACYALVVAFLAVLANSFALPERFQDEFLYFNIAESTASGEILALRGSFSGLYSSAYVFVITPAFWTSDDPATIVSTIRVINALAMATVIFPIYFAARLIGGVTSWQAMAAALLTVISPFMHYAGMIGTEAIALPAFVLTMYVLLRFLTEPTRRLAGILTILGIGCIFVRSQLVVVFPIIFISILFVYLCSADEAKQSLKDSVKPLVATALLLVGSVTTVVAVLGAGKLLGLYGGLLNGAAPSISTWWFWVSNYLTDSVFLVGIIPAVTLVAAILNRSNWNSNRDRALLVVTLISLAALILQATLFCATSPDNLMAKHYFYERYIIYAAPIMMVCFVAFLGSLNVKRYIASSVIILAIICMMTRSAILKPFSFDAFNLTVVTRFLELTGFDGNHVGFYLLPFVALIVISGWMFVRHTRNYGLIYLAVGLALSATLLTTFTVRSQTSVVAKSIPSPVTAISQATEHSVGILTDSHSDANRALHLFLLEMFNPNVVGFYAIEDPALRAWNVNGHACPVSISAFGKLQLGSACKRRPDYLLTRPGTDTIAFNENSATYVKGNESGKLVDFTSQQRVTYIATPVANDGYVQKTGFNLVTFCRKECAIKLHVKPIGRNASIAKVVLDGARELEPAIDGSVSFVNKTGRRQVKIQLSGKNADPVSGFIALQLND